MRYEDVRLPGPVSLRNRRMDSSLDHDTAETPDEEPVPRAEEIIISLGPLNPDRQQRASITDDELKV